MNTKGLQSRQRNPLAYVQYPLKSTMHHFHIPDMRFISQVMLRIDLVCLLIGWCQFILSVIFSRDLIAFWDWGVCSVMSLVRTCSVGIKLILRKLCISKLRVYSHRKFAKMWQVWLCHILIFTFLIIGSWWTGFWHLLQENILKQVESFQILLKSGKRMVILREDLHAFLHPWREKQVLLSYGVLQTNRGTALLNTSIF
jgi:hypothetical protein